MSTPVPVPSKAALRALRGIALGTSCAIGLIVDDRRRRISTLRTAIENKKKLRASRHYHGAAEATLPLVDDLTNLSGDDLHWHYWQDAPEHSLQRPSRRHEIDEELRLLPRSSSRAQASAGAEIQATSEEPAAPVASSHDGPIQPSPGKARWYPMKGRPISPLVFKDPRPLLRITMAKPQGKYARNPEMLISDIRDMLQKDDDLSLDSAVRLTMDKYHSTTAVQLGARFLELSAEVCRRCQSKERWHDARKILYSAVRAGPLDEATFYAHDPITLIKPIIPALNVEHRTSGWMSLRRATQLFLTCFKEQPKLYAVEVQSLGETLINTLLAFDRPKLARDVYFRVCVQLKDPAPFTAWFISKLSHFGAWNDVLETFTMQFPKLQNGERCFSDVFEHVIQSVEAMKGAKSEDILGAMSEAPCGSELAIKPGWFERLLEAYWSGCEDIAQTNELFQKMLSQEILHRATHEEYVYKKMVELAVRGGDNVLAHHYYQGLVQQHPEMAEDTGLNGYIALSKAKARDWHGVRTDFAAMKVHKAFRGKDFDLAFVNVLKIFCEEHPLSEIEQFIKWYKDEMGRPLHRNVVTLIANKYGECHDSEGFVKWLQRCHAEGFVLDSSFCNAVLRNCWLQWKFDFRHLRRLFQVMRKMEPDCVDEVTERIMQHAALSGGKFPRTALQRVRSAKLSAEATPYRGRYADERTVLDMMTRDVHRGHPESAFRVYKRAVEHGMPWSGRCFNLAMTATLHQEPRNWTEARSLIHDAHAQQHDVTTAVSKYVRAQIDELEGPFNHIMKTLKSMITEFESMGIVIDPSILTHASLACLKYSRHGRAISLCKLAMEKKCTTNPCFSQESFRVFITVHWQTLDVTGMKWLVESLPTSPIANEKKTLDQLRSTRRLLARWTPSPKVDEFRELVNTAIEGVKQRRMTEREAGKRIADETLRIMKDAVAEMNRKKEEVGLESEGYDVSRDQNTKEGTKWRLNGWPLKPTQDGLDDGPPLHVSVEA